MFKSQILLLRTHETPNFQNLRERAQQVRTSMGQGYTQALAYANRTGVKVAGPKMSGIISSSAGKVIKTINVKVCLITVR